MHHSWRLCLIGPTLLAVACGGKSDAPDTSTTATHTSATTDDGGDEGGDIGGDDGDDGDDATGAGATGGDGGSSDDVPSATILDARCAVRVSGDTIVVWSVEGTATDPQGTDTLLPITEDGIIVTTGGAELLRTSLVCTITGDPGDAAPCSGTFESLDGTDTCDDAPSVEVRIEVEDEDGNRGASETIAGRIE